MGTAISTAAETLLLIEAIDRPSTGILYDPTNLAAMGERDDEAAIQLQQQHARHVHINDYVLFERHHLDKNAEHDSYVFRQRILGKGHVK